MIWTDWARQTDAVRIYLVELTVQKISDKSEVTLYLSNVPYESDDHFYIPCVSGLPRLTRQSNDTLSPNSVPSWGEIEFFLELDYRPDPANSLAWSTLLGEDYNLIGQSLYIKLGGEDMEYAEFQTVFAGKVGGLEYDHALLTLEVYDRTYDFERKEVPYYTLPEDDDTVPEANWGANVPVVYGVVKNYQPLNIDSSSGKFILASHIIEGITDIYINGLPTVDPSLNFTQIALSPVSKDGDGSATMAASGTYAGTATAVAWLIQIDDVSAGKEVGQATFRWSLDQGQTWIATGQSTSGVRPLADDIEIEFTTGTGDDFELYDEFSFILCSIMTLPGISDNEVLIDVKGKISDVYGNYIELPGQIIRDLVQTYAGWAADQIDLASVAAFDVAYPYTMGLLVDSPTSISEIVDQLLTGLSAMYTVTLAGLFYLEAVTAPSGSPVATLTDVELLTVQVGLDTENLYRRVYLNYDKAQQTTNSNTGIFQDWYEWASKDWRSCNAKDDLIMAYYSYMAKDLGPLDTCLVEREDAQAVASALLTLYKEVHALVTAEVKVQPFVWELGSLIALVSDKMNLAGTYRVLGMEHDFSSSVSTVKLWK